jgi:thiol:disulfide interchange protein DsbC
MAAAALLKGILMNKMAVWLAAMAITNSAIAASDEEMLSSLKQRYPNTRIHSVKASEVSGLWEVRMGDNVAYTDTTGRFFVFGHLYDMQQQVDLTAKRKEDSKKVEWPAKFLGNAIKTIRGNGQRTVAVFSDPDCPYCKRLEAELQKLDNITVYTFLYPMESLHPEAKARSEAVWCSIDPSKAWLDLMLSGRPPKLATCKTPLNDNLVLGSRLGVLGTPTLISTDGRMFPGMGTSKQIEEWLTGAAQ